MWTYRSSGLTFFYSGIRIGIGKDILLIIQV